MGASLALTLSLLAFVVAGMLSAVRLALAGLSPGAIRRIENTSPRLAEQFRRWYEARERYRVALRLLQCLVVAVLVYALAVWLRHRGSFREIAEMRSFLLDRKSVV